MTMMPRLSKAEEALGLPLPSRRLEEWKWTDLSRLIERPYQPTPSSVDNKIVDRLLAANPFAAVAGPRIVLVNGRLDRGHSRLAGVALKDVVPPIGIADPLIDLNTKLGAPGVTLSFSGTADTPVHVVCVTVGDGSAIASRVHLDVSADASATVIECHLGEGGYLHNPLVTVSIGAGARLDRVKLEREASSSQHLSHLVVTLGVKSHFNDLTLTAGASLSRQNGTITFAGEHATARVNGAYLLHGKQHVDTRLVVDHAVPNCVSRELFKCVMQEQSRGIFQGKVIVRPDAQKTDGKQSSHALLLSETAEFDAKPELEIYADDVVCGHGTTCGDLNHDHLFYLRSRGIPEAQARALLVEAFVAEAIEAVENETVRDVLTALVHERMG